ncbi:hypothetical protein RDWZM_001797 [Blomia tropicalis]|uniref:Uncharacterized protein n=1 Tax=Blomia tropicalis TaxID=40697 RepID=A0A9Q0MCT7_BLOTA|nr:hypothetical protein RDWZM_001797 [Blomia tropicalis]
MVVADNDTRARHQTNIRQMINTKVKANMQTHTTTSSINISKWVIYEAHHTTPHPSQVRRTPNTILDASNKSNMP